MFSILIAILNTCASDIQTSLMAQCFMERLLSLSLPGYLALHSRANPRKRNEIQVYRFVYFLSVFGDIVIVVSDHLLETKGWFWVQVRGLYLGRCWKWIRKPDSRTDSSQIGASTPDSTFSWTVREREEKGKRNVINYRWGKTWEKSPWKRTEATRVNDSIKSVGDTSNFPSIFFAIHSLFHHTTREVFAF